MRERKTIIVSALCAVVLAALFMLAACAPATSAVDHVLVRVENPLDALREDEVVRLEWGDLNERLPSIDPDNVRVLRDDSLEEVVSQTIDEDGDGATDALLFLAVVGPREMRAYRVEAAASEVDYEPRTYAVHIPTRDDLAWENDRIAFRTYGRGLWETEDLISSGIDAWTKRTRDLVIDRWYAEVDGSYHQDWGQGADFYKVGPTMGSGGTALWRDGRIHRAPNFSNHRIIANGPIRTIFELEYEPWDAAGVQVSELRRITIDAGDQFFLQETTFETAERDPLEIAIGIVKREGVEASTQTEGSWAWLNVWGPLDPTVGGHGDLGSAIVLDRAHLQEMTEADDHHLVVARANSGEPVPHYIGTAWTASGDFEDAHAWLDHVEEYIRQLENPLRVTF